MHQEYQPLLPRDLKLFCRPASATPATSKGDSEQRGIQRRSGFFFLWSQLRKGSFTDFKQRNT
jgi:hypothetical protein